MGGDAPGVLIPIQFRVSAFVRSLKRRLGVALAGAMRRLRRASIVASAFFRTVLEKLPVAPSTRSSAAATAHAPAAAREGRYLRQQLPGDIVALRLLDAEAATIDAWYEDCTMLMSGWGRDQRLRYLHDVRNAEALKPHSIDRVTKLLKSVSASDAQDGRGAVLLNNNTVAATLNGVVGYFIRNQWQIRCFSDEAEAVRWLSE